MASKYRRCVVTVLLCFIAVLLICPGCGGNSSVPSADHNGQTPAPPATSGHNTLATHMPPLTGLAAGAEFEYSVNANFKDALYQGCGRIVYDASVMQPIAATRGAAIPAADIFVAKLDAPSQVLPGSTTAQSFVPFAFTGLPDNAAHPGISGELIKVKFRLLKDPPADCHISLLNDQQFLQLRSPQATRLPFDMQLEVTEQ
jgi:hypothetical protein